MAIVAGHSSEFIKWILEHLETTGIPKGKIRGLVLRAFADEVVTVDVTYYPEGPNAEISEKRFKLNWEEIKDADES